MSRTNWKAFERKVARDLGTQRVLQKGRSVPDVLLQLTTGHVLVVECKNRAALSVKACLTQAQQYADELGKPTLCVLASRKTGARVVRVFCNLKDALTLYGITCAVALMDCIVELPYADFVCNALRLRAKVQGGL